MRKAHLFVRNTWLLLVAVAMTSVQAQDDIDAVTSASGKLHVYGGTVYADSAHVDWMDEYSNGSVQEIRWGTTASLGSSLNLKPFTSWATITSTLAGLLPATQYYAQFFRSFNGTDHLTDFTFITAARSAASGAPDMVRIPAGSFNMGDQTGGAIDGSALPVHSVYLSEFYIDKYEVYGTLWDEVKTWGIDHGYSFTSGQKDNENTSEQPDMHPVINMMWVDAIKFCNARSEMMGFTPCYYTSGAKTTVYRTGTSDVPNDAVDWSANGFRLPTEAEWEKASRGGLNQNYYPWPSSGAGDIDGSKCNYRGSNDPFEAGAGAPEDEPFCTTPVGYYAADGYGLYDMVGNAAEWVWDRGDPNWYGNAGATVADNQGPATGTNGNNRVFRGSSMDDGPGAPMSCAWRGTSQYIACIAIDYAHIDFGLRTVRNSNLGTTDAVAPSAPTALVSSNITSTTCTVSWTASTDNVGVTGYEVFIDGISAGVAASTSLDVTGLVCATAQSFTVKARDAVGNWSTASSALPITTSACVPGTENVINDDNARIAYSGAWESGSYNTNPGNINLDEHLTNATDASASFTFTGSSISWIGTSSANRGIVDVYIDNVKVASADAYSSALSFQKVLYTNTSLSSGSHTIKLVNTGTKNTSSSGTYLIVDAFKYTNPGTTRTIGSRYLKSFQQQSAFVTAQGMIIINLSSGGFTRVRISDSNGRLVYSTIAAGKLIMPASAIKPGVYFVSEQCDGLTRAQKVAISR